MMNEKSFGQNADSFLDILVAGAGIFLIYAAVVMKVKGEIPKSILSKNIDLDTAPDKEGYISHMFIPCICMGILLLAMGTALIAFTYLSFTLTETQMTAFYIGSMAVVIAFGVYTMNMQNRYLKKR